MVPDRLFMSGFRSYELPTEINLDHRGIICIVGHNGAGKSSILKAMLWTLWAIGGHSVINHNSKTAIVEMDFTTGKDRFRVRRTMSANKHTLDIMKLKSNGETTPLPFNGLKGGEAMLTEILGLDKDSFIHSCFVGQNEADAFSKLPPKQRREVISNMLGLWRFQELSEMAGKKRLSLEKELAGLSATLEQIQKNTEDPIPYTKELDKILDEKKNIEKELENNSQMLDNVQRGFVKRAKLLSEQEAAKKRRDKLRSNWKKVGAKLSELKERKKKYLILINEKEKIQNRMAEYEKAKEKFDLLRTKRDEHIKLKQKILGLKQHLSELTEELERKKAILQGKRESSQKRIATIEENLAKAADIEKRYTELVQLRETLEKSRAKADRYARLGTTIKNIEEMIAQEKAHIEDKIKLLNNELATEKPLRRKANEIEKQIAIAKNKLTSLDTIAAAEAEVKKTLNKLEQDAAHATAAVRQEEEFIIELKEKRELLSAADDPICPLCGASLNEEHRNEIIADYDKKIKIATDTINQNETKLQTISQERNELNEKLAEIRDAQQQAAKMREHIAALRSELKTINKRFEELSHTADEYNRLKETLSSESYAIAKKQELSNTKKAIAKMNYIPGETESLQEAVAHLAGVEREMNIIEKNQKEIINEKENIRKIEDELLLINQKLAGDKLTKIQNEITTLEQQLKKLAFDENIFNNTKKQYDTLMHAPNDLANLMSAESAVNEISNQEKQLTDEQNEIEIEGQKLATLLSELTNKLLPLSKLDTEQQKLSNKQNELRNKLNLIITSEGELKEKLTTIRNKREQIKKLKKKYNTVEHNTKLHRILENATGVNGVQAHILAMSIPFLESEANRILGTLTGGDITIKMKADAHEKLSITVQRADNSFAYTDLSGGERFRVDFALRIALSRLISRRAGQELSVLIVDEGFSSQDEEGLALVADVLDAIAPEFERILVISHIENIKNSFPTQILVRRDDEMGSVVETVGM